MSHAHSKPRPLRRLWALFQPERGDLWRIVFFALFVSLLSLVIPIGIEALVTTVTFGVALWPLIWLAGIMLFCLGLAAGVIALETWLVELLQRRLFVRVVADFAERIPRLQIDSLSDQNGPSLLNRFFEVMTIQKAAAVLVLDGTRLLVTLLVGITVLAFYHPLLMAFALGLVLATAILVLLGRGGFSTQIDESGAKYEMADWLQDLARHPRLFKTGHGPHLAVYRADAIARDYLAKRSLHFRVVFRQILFGLFIYVASSVLLLGLGGYLVIQQQLTIGQLVAAELIVALVVGNFIKLGKYLDSWYDIGTGVEKLGHITDLPIERLGGSPLPVSGQGIRLRFEFEGRQVEVNPGERVALVTSPNADLTCWLERVSGLRDAERGQARVDGIDVADLNLVTLREHTYLLRDIEFFHASVFDNMQVGRKLADATVRAALLAANLLEVVTSLPEGLNTRMLPSGHPLSVPEALRFGIARGLAARPRLMVLDGALDAIDLDDCPGMLPALFDRAWNGTLLVVTRDARVIEKCDRRIVLND